MPYNLIIPIFLGSMKHYFIQTVKDHTLEFYKPLFQSKYAIMSKDVMYSGIVIVAEKDVNGHWGINHLSKFPEWVKEITFDLFKVIEENELRQSL